MCFRKISRKTLGESQRGKFRRTSQKIPNGITGRIHQETPGLEEILRESFLGTNKMVCTRFRHSGFWKTGDYFLQVKKFSRYIVASSQCVWKPNMKTLHQYLKKIKVSIALKKTFADSLRKSIGSIKTAICNLSRNDFRNASMNLPRQSILQESFRKFPHWFLNTSSFFMNWLRNKKKLRKVVQYFLDMSQKLLWGCAEYLSIVSSCILHLAFSEIP